MPRKHYVKSENRQLGPIKGTIPRKAYCAANCSTPPANSNLFPHSSHTCLDLGDPVSLRFYFENNALRLLYLMINDLSYGDFRFVAIMELGRFVRASGNFVNPRALQQPKVA